MAKLAASDYFTPQQIKRREMAARAMRDEDLAINYLCYAHGAPGANPYLRGLDQDPQARIEGSWRSQVVEENSRLYDAQLAISLRRFAERIMAELFPDGVHWAHLKPGDDTDPEAVANPLSAESLKEIAEREKAREEDASQLQPLERLAFNEHHRSNFSMQAPDAILDACIARVGVLMARRTPVAEPGPRISWEHIPQAECSFIWGPDGTCWGIHRRHYFNAEEAKWAWPDGAGWTFPKSNDPMTARSTFTETAYRVAGKRPWAYQVIQDSTEGEVGLSEIARREYPRNPYVVFGVNCAPGARLGRSICELALPTARSLNAMARINLQAAEFRATPNFTVQGALANVLQWRENAVGRLIPVESNEQGGPTIRPLDVPGQIDLGWSAQERMQMLIRQLAYDEGLPPDTPQPKTKFEIRMRMRELQNTLGSIFQRIMNTLGRQVLQHTLDALRDAGMGEGKNQAGGAVTAVELDDAEVKLSFANPLATQQKMLDVESIFSVQERLNQSYPTEIVAAAQDQAFLVKHLMEQTDFPAEAIRKGEQQQGLAQQAEQTLVTGGAQAAGGQGTPREGGGISMMGEMAQ